jgi:outer membrane immunogenic protein
LSWNEDDNLTKKTKYPTHKEMYMKKYPRLSAIFVAVSAASFILASTTSFAMHHGKMHKEVEHENYKAENYKAEVPPCPPVRVLLDGFYVGAGVSYDSYRFNSSWSVSDAGDTAGFHNHLSSRGWDGDLNVGYGRYWDAFYLAGEVHGVISGADGSVGISSSTAGPPATSSSINVNVKARGSWAVSVLPGMKLNDSTLAYVRLGYIQTNFKASGSATDDGVTFSASNNKWKGGFIGGVGMETWVADNVSLRGEYQYSAYSNFSNGFGSVKPSNSSFTLGLGYHFA